ncbi:MAG TPA: glycosyltransferase family 9 protein [Candidatus Angelobacter sp.]|nr:glycosyltransferase family 9 protein [Candidatus Angelobacter sp.]
MPGDRTDVTPVCGKILVIRGGAIGDFILTLPALSALRKHFPGARLEVLGYPHIAQLALSGGGVDAVRSIESRALAGFFARGGRLDGALQNYFAGFAVIISYLYDPDGIFQSNVASCSNAQFIAGPHRPDEKEDIHAADVFLKPLERLAIFDADPVPELSTSSHPSIPNQLALHPGSGSERKNWPEENWMRLIQHLQTATKFNFLLVGGEAERERLRRLSAVFRPERLERAECLPLAELARRLQACAGFIGHDSGISHLAVAVGLTALILWGETNETIWRPRGTRVTLLRSTPGLMDLPVESVRQSADSLFKT